MNKKKDIEEIWFSQEQQGFGSNALKVFQSSLYFCVNPLLNIRILNLFSYPCHILPAVGVDHEIWRPILSQSHRVCLTVLSVCIFMKD